MLISCAEISKGFTGEPLFHSLSVTINENEKLGIIGRNGCGKSTLLSILAKKLDPDAGEVAQKKNLRVACVEQTPVFPAESEVLNVLEAASLKAQLPEDERVKLLSIITKRAGLQSGLVEKLSGGMKKRLALACALVEAPELILLDEPTNHLDVKGIVWLENELRSCNFAWACITHDRWFLQRTVTRILEINKAYQKGYFVEDGDYRRFLEKKEIFLHAQARERDVLANKVRRETEWLHQGIKARGTRAKYRTDQAYELMSQLSDVEARLRETNTNIAFLDSERKTKKLIEVKDACKSFGDKTIFKNLNLVLSPNMRLGLLGANGCGKTTILKTLAQLIEPDEGVVKHAPDLQISVFEQHRVNLNPDWSVHRALCEYGDSVVFNGQSMHIHAWAARFQLRADQLNSPVSALSGGEQARVAIAQIMLKPADVLLLDEPTNDLDIPALEVLEESLLNFKGAIVLVTHDRYLIDKVCQSFLAIDQDYQVNSYADYAQWEKSLSTPINNSSNKDENKSNKKAIKNDKPQTKKLTYREQQELAGMEGAILEAEEKLASAEVLINDAGKMSDPEKAKSITQAWQEAKDLVDRLYARWDELSSR